jgi:hypothetical protein
MTKPRAPLGSSNDRRALATTVLGATVLTLVALLAVGTVLPRSTNAAAGSTVASTSSALAADTISPVTNLSHSAASASTASTPETSAPSTSSSSTGVASATGNALSKWVSATNYPTNESGSCVRSGSEIYCVGGDTNAAYYATISTSGVGSWTSTTAYPNKIAGQSCAASGGYIYCVSGIDGTQGPRPTGAVYFAPVSPSGGVGAWVRTADYPSAAIALSCSASAGYVYCVGGANTVGTLQSNATYYAQASSSGVSRWAATTAYPSTVDAESCVASGGFIYCIAGYTAQGPRAMSSTYFAPISSAGIGVWTAGAAYPTVDYGLSCVTVGGYVYCMGGIAGPGGATDAVYYAQLSSAGGIGAWSPAESYPTTIVTSCVAIDSVIACVSGSTSIGVDGRTSAGYYALASSR